MQAYDTVIIGRGPAGISAALYTVRAGLSTLVLGKDEGALKSTEKIENYYGFENPVSGKELLQAGEKQAVRLGASIVADEVTALEFDGGFTVKTVAGGYTAKAVLIATGKPPRRPDIPGVKEFEGRGVSYCTTCDGFFYKGKTVGVLGSGNYAVQEATELEPFTKDITIFTNGASAVFTGGYADIAKRFAVESSPVRGLSGDKVLGAIALEGGEKKLDGFFIAGGTASSVDFAVKLGVNTRDSAIITDTEQKTNLPGVFAAGDCTGGFKQVAVAVGQGALAGHSIIDFIGHR